jgi:Ca2+-binding RTX toxin-like protein
VKLLGRGIGIALVVAGSLLALGAAPEEDDPRCHGRQAKIVGTDGDDKLRGTPQRDVIWGGLGDDEIVASLGNDLVCGGPGADLLHGGRGNDRVDGGAGDADIVVGDLGDDELFGGPGNGDEVAGSLGIDIINGGPGSNDLVHGDYGYDRIDGGAGGGDTVSYATDVASDKGAGVWVSLPAHKARGDGHDRIFRTESIEGSAFGDVLIGDPRGNAIDGGPGNDKIFGGKGSNRLEGGQGKDGCKGGPVRASCGRERRPHGSAYVEMDQTPGGGGGLAIIGGGGNDRLTAVTFDPSSQSFGIAATKGIALGPGCKRPAGNDLKQAICTAAAGRARWLMADLGPGDDSFRAEGSLAGAQNVRIAGGPGDDTIHGGPEDDLIEAGEGADRLYGEAGADGLIGGLPGPTFLYGGQHGDLLAAGGGCAGGAIVGGPGRDDASFAETQAHPGLLIVSFPKNKAWIDEVRGCKPVALADSNEDMEGSFDYDVLIGDGGPNAMLGQPGKDEFYGGGGDDIVDARDGVRDTVIQCGAGTYVRPPRKPKAKGPPPEPILRGTPAGRALTDSFDPPALLCAVRVFGTPVKGLNHAG